MQIFILMLSYTFIVFHRLVAPRLPIVILQQYALARVVQYIVISLDKKQTNNNNTPYKRFFYSARRPALALQRLAYIAKVYII